MQYIKQMRPRDVYRAAVVLLDFLAGGPSLASWLPELLPSVLSARPQFSCVLQPK